MMEGLEVALFGILLLFCVAVFIFAARKAFKLKIKLKDIGLD